MMDDHETQAAEEMLVGVEEALRTLHQSFDLLTTEIAQLLDPRDRDR
ncbi:MAG: hypothetical protein ACP5HZ_11430 [Ferrimicrobium sp.]|nr:hypothetical protein [Ferrimicrobium sp.]